MLNVVIKQTIKNRTIAGITAAASAIKHALKDETIRVIALGIMVRGDAADIAATGHIGINSRPKQEFTAFTQAGKERSR